MSRALEVTSEMTAAVLSVEVVPGDTVAEGTVLLVVESMKMEIPIISPGAGTVRDVRVGQADVVAEGDTMVVISSP